MFVISDFPYGLPTPAGCVNTNSRNSQFSIASDPNIACKSDLPLNEKESGTDRGPEINPGLRGLLRRSEKQAV